MLTKWYNDPITWLCVAIMAAGIGSTLTMWELFSVLGEY